MTVAPCAGRLRPASLVLLVLITGFYGCAGGDHRAGTGEQAAGAGGDAALSASTRELLARLPADHVVPGWERAREPRRYGAGNLWEYINGAAETYLAYGFQEVASGEYVNQALDVRATVDIYRMTDATAAFGIYAEERHPEAPDVALGAGGYDTGNTLNFRAGPCYVKITANREHPALRAALGDLAVDVARRIGENGGQPAVFDRFPSDNLDPRSLRVVPKDVLGQSYLPHGFQAGYGSGSAAWTLVLIPFETGQEAAAAFDAYRQFLSGSGAAPRGIGAPGDAAFAGRDTYYGLVVAARAGQDLAIVLGARNEKTAVTALAAVLQERTTR
ncbi:MAG TPA: DUF6599 family protein [Vicinamibacterales bacterium]|nr:DUF6599 family protein [Vicinamibacterales bacterium]